MNALQERCRKCGGTLRRALLLAMLQDAGAKCHPGAMKCPHGGEHEWFCEGSPENAEAEEARGPQLDEDASWRAGQAEERKEGDR